MNKSILDFNELIGIIDIRTDSHHETIEALEYLVGDHFIDNYDFQTAYFKYTHHKGATLELTCNSRTKKFQKVIIHSVNLKNIDAESGYFDDLNCAVKILKMFRLYLFDSIYSILKYKENYYYNDSYNILVDKSGLFRWDTKFGGQFIYD